MDNVILIDALYINDGGGKILLDYLITELEKSGKEVLYLLDKRVEKSVPQLTFTKNSVVFSEASLLKRYHFYNTNKNRFHSALCFGNLPPNIKLGAKVYTYFHQPLFLNVPENIGFISRLKYSLKVAILKIFKKNTDYWLVQSIEIQNKLSEKYNIKLEDIKVLPFYPELQKSASVIIKNSYLYISNATPHKNHERLINAFCNFFNVHKTGELILTVAEHYKEVINLINEKKAQNYPIKNIGFIKREKLAKIYSEAEFLIFPSLAESFGLGLVEAIDAGCKVIGADLPYTFAVCEPSLVFDPHSEGSIVDAFTKSLKSDIKISTKKLQNEIETLLKLL